MKLDRPPAKILCVDDDRIVRAMYGALLTRAGYACEFASDGRSALNAVRGAPAKFDLVITDLEMPGMDGWSLVRHLVEMSFPGKILVASSTAQIAEDKGLRELAVDTIYSKPLTASRLLGAVEELIGNRSGATGGAEHTPHPD